MYVIREKLTARPGQASKLAAMVKRAPRGFSRRCSAICPDGWASGDRLCLSPDVPV
jgi:hypothetical protein